MTDTEKLVIAGLVVALASFAGGVGLRNLTRGIRNNNPGNIRRTGINWLGEVAEPLKSDAEFEQFIAPEYGIRALAREMRTSIGRRQTLRELINEYAPPSENDTEAYVVAVSNATGIPPTARPKLAEVFALVNAIIRQENGFNPYPDQLVAAGVDMAA